MITNNKILLTSLIWLCITMFYCYQFILRFLPSIIMPELMAKFNIGATDFGAFAGIYYLGYIIIHIPVGLALSRFGGKIVLPIFVILAGAGLLPIIYSESWSMVLVGRFLIGIGSSAAIVGAFQIFRTISPEHFTRMLGIMVCFGLITAVYISKPLAKIINIIGMTTAINFLVISGIILSIISYVLIPKSTSPTLDNNIWADIKSIICNKKLVIVSILAGLMVGPMEGFADAWGSAFLNIVYKIERNTASSFISLIFTGMCCGCIILPFIADKSRAYYGITLLSAIIMTLCFLYLLIEPEYIFNLGIIFFIIGVFCAYQVIIISKISTYVPENLSGTAASVANMIIMAFGSFFHSAIGNLVERSDEPTIINGLKTYSKSAYITAISVIPIAMIIAMVGFCIIILINRAKGNFLKNQIISN